MHLPQPVLSALARQWRGRARFVVLAGAHGEHLAALVDAWRADPQRPTRLHLIVLGAPLALPGVLRSEMEAGAVVQDAFSAPLASALNQVDASVDAFLLGDVRDCGARWIGAMRRLAASGATLHAYALEGAQLRALASVGFACKTQDGHYHAQFDQRHGHVAQNAPAARHALVIGAGLAGSAICQRLAARGWRVSLVERHAQPAQEASGNHAGIFMPLLSKDDNVPTRLVRAAYLYALRYWQDLGGIGQAFAGAQCGVLQLARDPGHAQVQRAIAAAHGYPPEFAEWLEPDRASARLGGPAPDGAWWFAQGGWARPSSLCAAMLGAAGGAVERHVGVGAIRLVRDGDRWQAVDAGGACIATAPLAILACGTGAVNLAQGAALPLTPVRGQVTHLDAAQAPQLPFVLCRESYMTPPVEGIVSVGASYDLDADPALRASSQQENLDRLAQMLGRPIDGAGLAGRVGFRCVAPDRLPLVGALPDAARFEGGGQRDNVARWPGLQALLGYASRGLIWAPLAAELLAARLEGEPLPMEANLAAALDPARFLLRQHRPNVKY